MNKVTLRKGSAFVTFTATGAGYNVFDSRLGRSEYMGRYGAIDWFGSLQASGWSR